MPPADPSLTRLSSAAGNPLRLPEPAKLLEPAAAAAACKHLLDRNEAMLANTFTEALARNPYPKALSELLAKMLIRDTLSANLPCSTILGRLGCIHINALHSSCLFAAIDHSFAEQSLPAPSFSPRASIHTDLPIRSQALYSLYTQYTQLPDPKDDRFYFQLISEHDELDEAIQLIAKSEHAESFLIQPLTPAQISATSFFRRHSHEQSAPSAWSTAAQTLADLCFEPSEAGLRCAAWLCCHHDLERRPFARELFAAARQSLEKNEIAKHTQEAAEQPNLPCLRL